MADHVSKRAPQKLMEKHFQFSHFTIVFIIFANKKKTLIFVIYIIFMVFAKIYGTYMNLKIM